MKYFKTLSILLLIFLCSSINTFGINDLVVKVPGIYTSKPGYIDKSILVIEPHGGYCEQSLYLKYSDHFQFSQGSLIEVIHRFELPKGAVVNDMWLWIGDSIMQAKILDTWKARSIYDSIVSMKRDPAFLTKKGDQYELHIYPLEAGKFRQIKINFITPTRWIGNEATIELPIKMLKANNNSVKPIDILFRTKENIWGYPRLEEFPQLGFVNRIDTAGYNYMEGNLRDIGTLQNINLNYNVSFSNGTYFRSSTSADSLDYFQLALSLKDVFGLKIDSINKKAYVGLDLSGDFNKDYSTLIPKVKKVLKSALKANDTLKLVITGAGKTKQISDWIQAKPENIDNAFNDFLISNLADSIKSIKKPELVYCDYYASECWNYSTINALANTTQHTNIYNAVLDYSKANIIAAYSYGYDNLLSEFLVPEIISKLDSFFIKGGRFLTYYDFNRDLLHESIATHYIKGLSTKSKQQNSITLYRNTDGNIGSSFSESIDHAGTYFLNFIDPDVKIELMDKNGNPAVISKKVGNGLIVVSGIWSFNDDDPLKKMLGIPMLGLNKSSNYSQLPELLENVKTEFSKEVFDKVFIFSNSDSLISKQPAENWIDSFISHFTDKRAEFNSINLLDNSINVFPAITINNTNFLCSGYILKVLSDTTMGQHFESNINDWDLISSSLSAYSIPKVEQLNVKAFSGNNIQASEFREIKNEPVYNNNPRYFIGSTNPTSGLIFDINAKFEGNDTIRNKRIEFPVQHNVTVKETLIPSILGNEKIKDLYKAGGTDTSKIVELALKYNLLCDYTALLALEPNDTIHFMVNPLDESDFATSIKEEEQQTDTLSFSVYPNPFNSQTNIVVKAQNLSRVNIHIYNILGQLVSTIADNEEITGSKTYRWNGVGNNLPVSSGIYFIRLEMVDQSTAKKDVITKKLLLLK